MNPPLNPVTPTTVTATMAAAAETRRLDMTSADKRANGS